jgi:magnesium transporter
MKTIKENGLTLIDIEKPTQKDLEWLQNNFNIHPTTLSELISPSQREKVDHFNDYLFMVMYTPVFNEKKRTTHPTELDVIITQDHIIAVHNETIEPLKDFYRKIEEGSDLRMKYFGQTTGHLFYWMSEELLSFAERQLVHISKNINRVEDKLFKNIERDMIREISFVKRDVLDFRIAIKPMHRIFKSLYDKETEFWPEIKNLKIYFSDLLNDYERVWSEADNYTETINSLEATNTNLLNDKTNTIVKTFTIMSFITFPAMLVATVLQINTVHNPILGLAYDFWVIVGIVLATTSLMWFYFKTRKWL